MRLLNLINGAVLSYWLTHRPTLLGGTMEDKYIIDYYYLSIFILKDGFPSHYSIGEVKQEIPNSVKSVIFKFLNNFDGKLKKISYLTKFIDLSHDERDIEQVRLFNKRLKENPFTHTIINIEKQNEIKYSKCDFLLKQKSLAYMPTHYIINDVNYIIPKPIQHIIYNFIILGKP